MEERGSQHEAVLKTVSTGRRHIYGYAGQGIMMITCHIVIVITMSTGAMHDPSDCIESRIPECKEDDGVQSPQMSPHLRDEVQ